MGAHDTERTPLIRLRWLIPAAAVLAGAGLYLSSAHADPKQPQSLTIPGAQPTTTDGFLTAVTQDVDRYWTATFKAAGRDEPKVSYAWIPAGTTVNSACGELGAEAAAYCSGDDTIYISEEFADGVYNGALDQSLPGSANGFGRTYGDFAVAYMVAHEYGHQIQDELGLYEQYGDQLPTSAFELQADCFAGTWANSAYKENRLEEGDVTEALEAAQAVGDFDASNPAHHGTPEERANAWSTGFESGDPSACQLGA
jgi:predicted metalloprotease